MQTKKIAIILFSLFSIISMPTPDYYSPMAHAANDPAKAGETTPKNAAASPSNLEKFKADFAYEMAQLTAKIVSAPNNNVVRFKVLLESEIEQTVAKVTPTLPQELKADFSSEMMQIKDKIYSNPKLNIEKAKADFSYDTAQITTNYMTKAEQLDFAGVKAVVPAKVTGPLTVADNSNKESSVQSAPLRPVEKGNADFANEMAQLTAKIEALPNNNVVRFKVTLESEIDQTVAKVTPMLPQDQRVGFGADMERIKNKLYSNPKLNIEKAKYDFSNEIAQVNTKYGSTAGLDQGKTTVASASNKTIGAENKAVVNSVSSTSQVAAASQPEATARPAAYGASSNVTRTTKPISPETYNGIMNDLMSVGEQKKNPQKKVTIDGNVRYHYAANGGSASWSRNTSGLRARIGAEVWVNPEWRLNAMVEGKQNILNYDNEATFRASLTGKIRGATLQAGSFGYFMADGNIYDSTFAGGRLDFGGPVKYTLAAGSTDNSQQTLIATARHEALDYNVEAGVYNYLPNGSNQASNTIVNLAGNYKFSNFSLGSMILLASRKDSQGNTFGYVHSLNYGDLKTWRAGTYGIFARYYYQPRYTYIMPTMNGRGGSMQGFQGFGIGVYYTLAENVVGGLEYYNLRDITTGEQGSTWWGSVTCFF